MGDDELMPVLAAQRGAGLTPDDVRQWCAERLAGHKVPRFVVLIDALSHTPTHKVAKHALGQDLTLRVNAVDFARVAPHGKRNSS